MHSVFNKNSVVRDHHIYKTYMYWTPVVGEELTLETEDDNEHNEHAVAVMKDGYIVGHMPHSLSKVSWFFLFFLGFNIRDPASIYQSTLFTPGLYSRQYGTKLVLHRMRVHMSKYAVQFTIYQTLGNGS